MRISTNQIYDQNMRSIMQNQGDLAKTQEQLASGKRIITPSDDPVGAAKVLRLTEEIDELTQFQRNNDLVTGSLEQQEAVLTNITNSVNRARTLIVQAGNGILDDPDKRAIGSELEQIKLEIFDLMNTQDADGNYLYAGYQSGNQAFTFNPASGGNAISFSGDAGVNFIQLSNSSKIQSTSNGYEVFENVLSRFNFSVTANTVTSLEGATVKEQGTFDTFFNNNCFNYIKNKKIKIKGSPKKNIENIIEKFKFKIPKNLPPISSLLSGYFSYDVIRYIEKIPNSCKDDLKIPDARILRPRTLIIHDNYQQKIYYIINCFADEKINNYKKKYISIENQINNLIFISNYNSNFITNSFKGKINVKSNISKNKFLHNVMKAKKYIKIGDIFQVVLSQRFEAKLTKNNGKLTWIIELEPNTSVTKSFSYVIKYPEDKRVYGL